MPTNFSRVIRALTTTFQKAGADAVADLEDSLYITVGAPDRGNRPRTPTGPQQAMAGGRAADKFVSDYSKDTDQADGLMQGYAAMAEELASQSKRVESVEKSVNAIAKLIAQSFGKSFPEDETEKRGDEDADTDEKREDEESAKALPTLSIPGLMRELSGASRATGKVGTLAQPPNFAVTKANVDRMSVLEGAIEALPAPEQVMALSLVQRMKYGESNPVIHDQFVTGLGNATEGVQKAFASAGIVSVMKAATRGVRFG